MSANGHNGVTTPLNLHDRPVLKYTIEPGCPVENPIREPIYDGDVGYDIRTAIFDSSMVLGPGQFYDIPTFVRIELPPGIWGDIRPRSSTYARKRLVVMNGTIDCGYRGSLSVFVFNPNEYDVVIQQGDYLAQLVLLPIFRPSLQKVAELSPSKRGAKGFGSSDSLSSSELLLATLPNTQPTE